MASADAGPSTTAVSALRVRAANQAPARPGGAYVLYWMISSRRTRSNFALERAVEWANHLGKPLLVLEALRVDYPWACDRFHQFALEGMAQNAADLAPTRASYYPYVEPAPGHAKGLLEALARGACLVVTDTFPAFFLPRMVAAAAAKLAVRVEEVDSNGLVPLSAPGKSFPTAFAFRRWLHAHLPELLAEAPAANPLSRLRAPRLSGLPRATTRRWPSQALGDLAALVQRLPLDHSVARTQLEGGSHAARTRLRRFVASSLEDYAAGRNEPSADGTSGLSPYLHFGHLSSFEVFKAVAKHEAWSPARLEPRAAGHREGFWGMGRSAEAFLDQLVTWRELGLNLCAHRQDYYQLASLPEWAQRTLARHAADVRPERYQVAALEHSRTSDPLWNAAQNQLVSEGRLHGYLRMLWGKKLLQWSDGPAEALAAMATLNDKYALDGRDPNSASGLGWVLGRFDRPWGPERPIFGTVRYMTSANTARKFDLAGYLKRYGG
jgi:deoxyribodipyrimidine photo-lyase